MCRVSFRDSEGIEHAVERQPMFRTGLPRVHGELVQSLRVVLHVFTSAEAINRRPLARNFVSPFPSPLYQASRTDFENFTRSAHVHSGGRQFAPGSIMLEGISPQSDTVGRLAPGWEGSHERKRSRLLLSGGSTGFPIPFLLIRPRS